MTTSSYPSTEALLTSLGWPSSDLDQKGALQWGAAVGTPPDKLMSAAVIVRPDAVVCRVRSAPLDGVPQLHLELTWAIEPGQPPVWKEAQRPVGAPPADEAEAVGWFKDYVNTMGTRAQFQAMGRRHKDIEEPVRPRVGI